MVNKNRMNRAAAAMAVAALMSVAMPAATAEAVVTPRIDLKVLVVDDGGSSVEAITANSGTPGCPTPGSSWAAPAAR